MAWTQEMLANVQRINLGQGKPPAKVLPHSTFAHLHLHILIIAMSNVQRINLWQGKPSGQNTSTQKIAPLPMHILINAMLNVRLFGMVNPLVTRSAICYAARNKLKCENMLHCKYG